MLFCVIFVISACTNPFAPKLADPIINISLLSDQKTVDGVFKNFRYAYIFKDTLVYGKLLDYDFTFVYRNYDLGIDNSWGRDEDMLTTYGLFQATQNMDLIWNDVVTSVFQEDSLTADISRGFTLSVVFSPTDIIRVQGRANFRLNRKKLDDLWKIQIWRDESNY
ncbi:MAG: hypothetical protein A2X61_11725 [Ignavibacteria bacterium GWB2_35_12]|nr:MAG: hypothetical protein A2X61_11725 [Ignavibacteria bacterium GWB2_35_12]OGU94562.1 MAG: hypothetical protein A2220_01530 [Ignavibacteria bacterium RIFOXYA2_FULL_35_10]OGV22439.1 MAG: hypothetical protein A2475_15585 [Ignavibacteria bacterium RIFOXYC2_FULL_35_21]